MSEYEINDEDNINGDDERIDVWEMGLPTPYDLTPLSQSLIPPELASAFNILPRASPYFTRCQPSFPEHSLESPQSIKRLIVFQLQVPQRNDRSKARHYGSRARGGGGG
ncbi:hypothetical protein OIU79_027864 [Salix purpurea]|uniref:Uncharacterized protein n=1 Tax=Salix purpurea TaxID=77065 RepID=A0A9Q1A2B6_SALPP|nr:hypothetical protein OIU79_027864 [Salix purpurea]